MIKTPSNEIVTFGWREWVALCEPVIPAIKAKVDTGARTSALHAFDVPEYSESEVQRVEFAIHLLKRDNGAVNVCKADIADERVLTDSGGHNG